MNPLETYGLPGVLIAGIIWLAVYLKNTIQDHKKEREELEKLHREEREKMFNAVQNLTENSNKTVNQNTNALTELSTLIKNNKK